MHAAHHLKKTSSTAACWRPTRPLSPTRSKRPGSRRGWCCASAPCARAGSLVLGTITCARRCVAPATLRHGGKAATRRIVVTRGRASVKLLHGTFSRRATKVRVAVRFDRHPATASGSVKLR